MNVYTTEDESTTELLVVAPDGSEIASYVDPGSAADDDPDAFFQALARGARDVDRVPTPGSMSSYNRSCSSPGVGAAGRYRRAAPR